MPATFPLAASGPRTPKRAHEVPTGVKEAIRALVWGLEGDPDSKPLNLVEAARVAAIKPWLLRRWVERPEGRTLLLRERRNYLAFALAGNPAALVEVRDKSDNPMAKVRAVQAIEVIAAEDSGRISHVGGYPQALQINILAADGSKVEVDASMPLPSAALPDNAELEPPTVAE